MAGVVPGPTPYADVNVLLHRVLTEARAILGPRFVGMYLYGSLALGDFDRASSDIDFVVVTTDELPDEVVAALQAMHARIGASDSRWAIELEGSYIPRDALRRRDPARARHPHIDRGSSRLAVEQHDSDWVIQRHILREHGIVLAGPPIAPLIDPVGPDEVRRAVLELIDGWWAPMLDNPTPMNSRGYQDYAVLTMCRALYAVRYAAIVSKPVAAHWARAELGSPWSATIDRALAFEVDSTEDVLNETLAFIRHAVERIGAERQDTPR